jgi:hypothetical protein
MTQSQIGRFFTKELEYFGIKIRSSRHVADKALEEARRRLTMMLANTPAILTNLVNAGVELHIIGRNENTSDLPENRRFKGKPFDGELTIDERTRGVGGRYASCGEENLLRLKKDRYRGYDICVHEFAHSIFEYGLSDDARAKIRERYKKSLANRKWKGAYARSNENEFFAELSMWYFGSRGDFGKIQPTPAPGPDWFFKHDKLAFRSLDDIYSGRMPIRLAPKPVPIESVPPDLEGSLRSSGAKPGAKLCFLNNRSGEVKVYWLDYNGKRHFYLTVPPKMRYDQPSFRSHFWLVTDMRGNGLAIFSSNSKSKRTQLVSIS